MRTELYPGLTLFQMSDGKWYIGLDVTTAHGVGTTSFELTKTMPEIQEAVNAWCAHAAQNPPVDQAARITALMYQIERLQQEIGVKQATIDAMNTNYAEQEARIKQLQRDLANAKKTGGNGLFGWMRR